MLIYSYTNFVLDNLRSYLPLIGKNVHNYQVYKIYLILNISMATFFLLKGMQ